MKIGAWAYVTGGQVFDGNIGHVVVIRNFMDHEVLGKVYQCWCPNPMQMSVVKKRDGDQKLYNRIFWQRAEWLTPISEPQEEDAE